MAISCKCHWCIESLIHRKKLICLLVQNIAFCCCKLGDLLQNTAQTMEDNCHRDNAKSQ